MRARRKYLRRNSRWLALGVLMLSAPAAFLYVVLDNDFLHGLVLGATLVGVPALMWSLVVQGTGTAHQALGGEAEQLTADELRKARRHGWRLVNAVGLGFGDIDHVLIGPSGALAVETKWTSAEPGTPYATAFVESAIAQAAANARSLRLWAPFKKLAVPVLPVLVLWGPHARDLVDAAAMEEHSGVLIVPGPAIA